MTETHTNHNGENKTENQIQSQIKKIETDIAKLKEITTFTYSHQEAEIRGYSNHDKQKQKLLKDEAELVQLIKELSKLKTKLEKIREENHSYGISLVSSQY
jgi:hypothetical protein